MSGRFVGVGCPRITQPICNGHTRCRILHTIPVNATIAGLRHVSEYRVFEYRIHRYWIRSPGRAGSHTKKPKFWINGPQLSALIKPHPDNVVTYALHLVTWQCRLHHRHVGFATCAWERSHHVSFLSLRVRYTQNLYWKNNGYNILSLL